MSKRAKLSANKRVLLVGGVFALGALVQMVAFASNVGSAHIEAGGDGYLNATEVAAGVTVTGTYPAGASPAIDAIKVFVVGDANCNLGSPNIAGPIDATLNANGTWTAGPFNVSGFPEAVPVCARARASDDGKPLADPNKTYTELATSDNKPIKDTFVAAGTTQLIDPNDDGYLNIVERDAGSVKARWTPADADAVAAQTWYEDFTNTILVGCEKSPATITGPASGEESARATCVTALPLNKTFTFHAQWKDAAGNVSAIANSNSIIKDDEAPAAPSLTVTTTLPGGNVNAANGNAVTLSGTIANDSVGKPENGDRVDLEVTKGASIVTGATTADGSNPAAYSGTLNLLTLPDGTLAARSRATDLASNVGPWSSVVNVLKDATAPTAPVVRINPKPIDQIHQNNIEVTVSNDEDGVTANLLITDTKAPPTTLTRTFVMAGPRTSYVDMSTLIDGLVTATARLTDSFGNVSAPGFDTAQKNTTGPAITIESPAALSLNKKTITVTGLAQAGSSIQLYFGDVEGPTSAQLNSDPIITSASGEWKRTMSFASGTYILWARTNLSTGGAKVLASKKFDVDADAPTVAIKTPNNSIYQAAQQVKIEGTATDPGLTASGVYQLRVTVFDARGVEVNPNQNPPRLVLGKTVADTNAVCALCPSGRNVTWSFDASWLPAGYYTVSVFAVDNVDNRSVQPATVNFLKL